MSRFVSNLLWVLYITANGLFVYALVKDWLHERLFLSNVQGTRRKINMLWYSTRVLPESCLNVRDGKIAIIVCRHTFAAHVFYFPETHQVTSNYADVVNVPLTEFDWWCTVPGKEAKR